MHTGSRHYFPDSFHYTTSPLALDGKKSLELPHVHHRARQSRYPPPIGTLNGNPHSPLRVLSGSTGPSNNTPLLSTSSGLRDTSALKV
ncbi:unnamed protein product [Peniophora sp. CBMAI 1063]|nr:unnamed protein product [Peniophora sp. CBMAI 1063]